jgi:DNA polymerase-3 subunit gamma/tau
MEPFIVSARKYRPQQFEEVVGQQTITATLLNAIEKNHLAQALLFCGPRGVGKTTCARILAKKINEEGNEREGEDFAFNIFELDAASNNSVDDIRNLTDQVRIPPQTGKYKVYIIDEVHMLSQNAFNAFLKTLEEPPSHAIFILATTEKHKIIPTILSRCQIFDFKRIKTSDAVDYLKKIAVEQGIDAEEDALHIIAQKADGAMRDALSIFDRVVSFAGNTLTRKAVAENLNVLDVEVYFQTTNLILNHDIPGLLVYFNQILSAGFEGHHFIGGLSSHFRDLMVCRDKETIALLDTSDSVKHQFLEQAKKVDSEFLLEALDMANTCELNYKASSNHRLLVELCLMQLASIGVGKKKKDPSEATFLIPASEFHHREPIPPPALPGNEDRSVVLPKKEARPSQAERSTLIETVLPTTQNAFGPTDASAPVAAGTESSPGVEVSNSGTPTASKTASVNSPAGSGEISDMPKVISPESPGEPLTSGGKETTNEKSGQPEPAGISEDTANQASQNTQSPGVKEPAKIAIKPRGEKVSGLSLSSIRAKKLHEAQKKALQPAPEELPEDPVDTEELTALWNKFTQLTESKGKKILASSLATDTPKLGEGHVIHISLPNSTMKKEVERDQLDLMTFLRKSLNNYSLQLQVSVNEEAARKYAFTPEEKYEKLKEKNPAIDLLRETFDLDL